MEYGNYNEETVIKNLIKNSKKHKSQDSKTRKRPRQVEPDKKFKKRKLSDNSSQMVEDNINAAKSSKELINNLTGSGATVNDETIGNIVKEFFYVNETPTDPRDKAAILRKLISIYKKIRDDKNKPKDDNSKMACLLNNLSVKLSEPGEHIKVNHI